MQRQPPLCPCPCPLPRHRPCRPPDRACHRRPRHRLHQHPRPGPPSPQRHHHRAWRSRCLRSRRLHRDRQRRRTGSDNRLRELRLVRPHQPTRNGESAQEPPQIYYSSDSLQRTLSKSVRSQWTLAESLSSRGQYSSFSSFFRRMSWMLAGV